MKFKLNPVVCGAASTAVLLTVHCRSTVVAIVSTNGGAQWRRLVGIESDDVGRLDTGRPPTLTQLLSKYTIFSFSRYVNVRIIIPTLSVFPHHAGDRKLFVIPFCHCFKQCDLSYLSRSPTRSLAHPIHIARHSTCSSTSLSMRTALHCTTRICQILGHILCIDTQQIYSYCYCCYCLANRYSVWKRKRMNF